MIHTLSVSSHYAVVFHTLSCIENEDNVFGRPRVDALESLFCIIVIRVGESEKSRAWVALCA